MTTTTNFQLEKAKSNPGFNMPQIMGRRLWAPMLTMALMAFPTALVLSWVRAGNVADGAAASTIAAQGHLVTGVMFIGFMAVFAAVSFAIARILGEFRSGGGALQEAVGDDVHTLEMPMTAKVFMASMMMGMMILLISVVLHFLAAAATATTDLVQVEQWAIQLEAGRRVGVALYLFGIALGLGTIVDVLRFQSLRIRQLPEAA